MHENVKKLTMTDDVRHGSCVRLLASLQQICV